MRIEDHIRTHLFAAIALGVGGALTCGVPAAKAQTVRVDVVTATNLIEQTASTGICYIAGKVGIGTATPSNSLHIKSSGTSTDILKVDNSNGQSLFKVRQALGNWPEAYFYNTNGTATYIWLRANPANWSYFVGPVAVGTNAGPGGGTLYVRSKDTWPIIVTGSNSASLFQLRCDGTDDGGSYWFDSNTAKVCVVASGSSYFNGGNVGVGTNNPSVALHVTGQGKFEQGLTYIYPLGDVSMGSYTNQ